MNWTTEGLGTYSFGHANTSIAEGEGFVSLVWDYVDPKVFAGIELAGIWERLITDLVESIGRVGDNFSEEDLFVRVDGVDDEREKLRDLSLKLESLSRHDSGIFVYEKGCLWAYVSLGGAKMILLVMGEGRLTWRLGTGSSGLGLNLRVANASRSADLEEVTYQKLWSEVWIRRT
jgi:hypothetical protein